MSGLTDDLVEEILARVPATSLKRLRSTCKKWNTLFNDRRFTKKHFDKVEKTYLDLMLCENKLSWISVNLHRLHDNADPSAIKFKGELSPNSGSDEYFQVFHCDGFLLCTNKSTTVVWNPCTGQTKWILTKSANTWDYRYALGYVNKKSGHDYKILRFLIQEPFVCEIFEFNSDSWRVSGTLNQDFLIPIGGGVSVMGNTYWIAYDNGDYNGFLISFDFTTERFGPRMCLPFQSQYELPMISLYSVREERLSMLFWNPVAVKIEIWVTKDIIESNVMSWSKFLSMDINFTHQFWQGVSFFIDEENKFVVVSEFLVYIIRQDRCRRVILGKGRRRTKLFSYVPSLVQI